MTPLRGGLLALLAAIVALRRASAVRDGSARDSSSIQRVLAALADVQAAGAGRGTTTPLPSTASAGELRPQEEEEEEEEEQQQQIETLIFVDVDGVLNTVVRDPAPTSQRRLGIELTADSLGKIEAKERKRGRAALPLRAAALMAVSEHMVDGDSFCYKEVASTGRLSDVYVERLASIVEAAGAGAKVVLSSSWRRYDEAVERLQKALSEKLQRSFEFDGKTSRDEEDPPAGRLENIGSFIAEHCRMHSCSGVESSSSSSSSRELRVLMLDDLDLSSETDLAGIGIDDIEGHLVKRVPAGCFAKVKAKFVHTYAEWTEPGGLEVRIGCGLTGANMGKATSSLGRALEQPKRGRLVRRAQPWSLLTSSSFSSPPPPPPSGVRDAFAANYRSAAGLSHDRRLLLTARKFFWKVLDVSCQTTCFSRRLSSFRGAGSSVGGHISSTV